VKNWRKSAEEAKTHLLFCVSFQSNKIVLTLKTRFDKSISISGSNSAGVWRRRLQPPEANGGSGAELTSAAAI